MKTENGAPAPAANVSTRDLAATLSKTVPAPEPKAKVESGATAPPAEPEADPTHEPDPATDEPGSLTTVETDEPEAPESPGAETPGEEPEPEPEGQPVKAALPPELAEAIEIAKTQGQKGVADLLKRVHKVVDARDTERNARLQAEEQNKNLRLELQQARTNQPQAAVNTTGEHPAVVAVKQELANVDHWMGWCEENLPKLQSGELESVELPDPENPGKKLKADAKDVAKTLRDLQNIRQEIVAKKVDTEGKVRSAYEAAHKVAHTTALTIFPEFKNPDSDWSKRKEQVLRAMPGMKQFPDHELMIGHFFRGLELHEKSKKEAPAGPKKVPAAREPARVVTDPPGSGAEPAPDGEKKAKASTQQFQKSGSTRDLARALTAKRQASRTK